MIMRNAVVTFYLFVLADMCVGVRHRASDTTVNLRKFGDCPPTDSISSFINKVCDYGCLFDIECSGEEKCCQSACGRTQCVIPYTRVDPCDHHECLGQGLVCQNVDGQPSCVCNQNCDNNNEPACADDDHIYTNRCWMDLAACQENTIIREISCQEDQNHPTGFDLIPQSVPAMLISGQTFSIDERKNFSLYCDASSSSPITFAWIVSQHGHDMVVLTAGRFLENLRVSIDGRVLHVDTALKKDEGNYNCLANNDVGLSTITHRITINSLLETETIPPTVPPTTTSRDVLDRGTIGVCALPLDRGHCFRQQVRWFYNLQLERCEPFSYTSCGGNGNRFKTYSQCSRTCPYLPANPCMHPIITGNCRARFMRWAFDEQLQECVEFVYGGCGANGNNFRTREDCGRRCLDTGSRKQRCQCTQPKIRRSYCKSDFVISGILRQKLPSDLNGGLFVVEIQEVYKGNDVIPQRNSHFLPGNLTIIRDLSQHPDSCQCLFIEIDASSLIFMGTTNEQGELIIEDSSYVTNLNEKRDAKVRMLSNNNARCPTTSQNDEPPMARMPNSLEAASYSTGNRIGVDMQTRGTQGRRFKGLRSP